MIDSGGNNIDYEINLRGRSLPAKAEADARASVLRRQADGLQHVGRLNCTGGACRTRLTSHAAKIERDDEGFPLGE